MTDLIGCVQASEEYFLTSEYFPCKHLNFPLFFVKKHILNIKDVKKCSTLVKREKHGFISCEQNAEDKSFTVFNIILTLLQILHSQRNANSTSTD